MPKITNRELMETFAALAKAQKEIASLEEHVAFLKAQLSAAIPAGGSRAGISHVIRPGSSVSWKTAAESIITNLVPLTKHSEATAIIKDNTKPTAAHLFKLEGENGK